MIIFSPEMGACSWCRVPVLPNSRVSGILGTRVRGNANVIQESRNAGTRNAKEYERYIRVSAKRWHSYDVEEVERRGGRGGLWTRYEIDPKPASRHHTPTPRTRVEGGLWVARWRVDPTRLIRPYTYSPRVMSCTPRPHVHSLTQEHRNANQERESTEDREKNVVQEIGTRRKNWRTWARGNAKVYRNALPSLCLTIHTVYDMSRVLRQCANFSMLNTENSPHDNVGKK